MKHSETWSFSLLSTAVLNRRLEAKLVTQNQISKYKFIVPTYCLVDWAIYYLNDLKIPISVTQNFYSEAKKPLL